MTKLNAYQKVEKVFLQTVGENGFLSAFAHGVTVAFSGGADSVLLLHLMKSLSEAKGFPLYCCHVHHGIRGKEADRDAAFCRDTAARFSVPFETVYVDVPAEVSASGIGEEEAARILRYRALRAFATKNGAPTIVTAHHAGDNLETVLFHLLRGSGLSGLAGIPLVNDGVYRPLLAVGKPEILAALDEIGEPFVTDSTNADTAYARNYIREKIVPALASVFPRPDMTLSRTVRLLRQDDDYLTTAAEEFLRGQSGDTVSRDAFRTLHPAVSSRVLRILAARATSDKKYLPEQTHIEKMISLAQSGKTEFCLCLPAHLQFIGDRRTLTFRTVEKTAEKGSDSVIRLSDPETITPDGEYLFFLVDGQIPEKITRRAQNVYSLVKQIRVSRDTIGKEWYLRHRKAGDGYIYGGMRHSLRKLFSDAKMTAAEKDAAWLLCDREGILYIPGFSVRDGVSGDRALLVYRKTCGEAPQNA